MPTRWRDFVIERVTVLKHGKLQNVDYISLLHAYWCEIVAIHWIEGNQSASLLTPRPSQASAHGKLDMHASFCPCTRGPLCVCMSWYLYLLHGRLELNGAFLQESYMHFVPYMYPRHVHLSWYIQFHGRPDNRGWELGYRLDNRGWGLRTVAVHGSTDVKRCNFHCIMT